MLPVPKATKSPEVKRISVKNFLKGTVTAFDDGRTPTEGLRSSGNVMLTQDGTVRPRPSMTLYGPQPTGTVQGEIFEFRARVGLVMTNWLICVQKVAGVSNVYIAKGEDTSWTKCTAGVTFDTSADCHFFQVADKVFITNGTDTLSYLDIPTSVVTRFTALTTPTVPTIANNGSTDITTGTKPFNVYYATTSNSSVGETAGSTVASIAVTTDRDLWDPTKHSLKVTRTAVTGEKSWNLYMGVGTDGAGQPKLYMIAQGLDKNVLTFVDDGSRAQDLTRVLPLNDSTAGPKATRGCNINGRAWLVGDATNPFYVWRGGDPTYETDFSPANGGGFSIVGNGAKELPVNVRPFRDGRGNFQITVLTQGTGGHGKRYILTPDSLTYGGQTFTFYDVTEDNGQDGTDSPDGIISYNDSLWYPSRDGFKTTGTKPQLQNILSTNRISNTIQGDIKSLNNTAMAKCVGLGFEGRLYWAVPNGSTTNNEIWVLDLDRQGAWMKPWSIAANWLTLYSDNSGTTHMLVLSNNKIYELSYTALTADNGVAFGTNGNSGQVTFSDDRRIWGKLIQLVFVILRPQGAISFSVSGKTEDSALAVVGTGSFTPTSTRAGWSEPKAGWNTAGWSNIRGWSEIVTVPVAFNDSVQEVVVEVDEELQWFSYGWLTTDPGVDYSLADVIAEYVEVGMKDLS